MSQVSPGPSPSRFEAIGRTQGEPALPWGQGRPGPGTEQVFLRKRRNRAASSGGGEGWLLTQPSEVQGTRSIHLTGAEVMHVRARSRPTPHLPLGSAPFQAASLPVDVVTGPGNPTAQWLSRSQIRAPVLADKGHAWCCNVVCVAIIRRSFWGQTRASLTRKLLNGRAFL